MTRDILLEVQKLTKVHGRGHLEVTALKDVSFTLAAGELVAVMGPSGCGKSTLLKLISLLSTPTSGTVRYAGQVAPKTERERARIRNEFVGYVHQDYAVIPYETALANARIPLEYARPRLSRRRQVAAAKEVLEGVGLGWAAGRKASQLSGGERQRVGIARAMINHPRLLLADEPTAALDSENAGQMVRLLKTLAATGSAVLVATHDPRVSEQCDLVIQLQDGGLVSAGSHQHLSTQ
ncbi:ABC transporter ATP-binding protein [Microbacterium aurum]|uniref:ABC transporter ATP-binding protein n=1 Tax=Microbacterium aurum TaxID=36805 RepID=UPI0028E54E33|nr:ABC transporter ATP-binding protein [Microbacterium aurum]